MNLKKYLFALVFVFASVLVACGNENVTENEATNTVSENESEIELLTVYTTIYPLYDFAKKIGGDHVEVKSIIPAGADAHTFEPTPKTMVDISNADLYIYSGAGIEGFADKAADVLKNGQVTIVKAAEGIELIGYDDDHSHEEEIHDHSSHDHGDHNHDDHSHDHTDEHVHEEDEHAHHDHGDEDPHVWLDPIRSIQLAENIKSALIQVKPEASEEFESNFTNVKAELEKLDQEFQDMVEEVTNDTIIVSHAGYGYWTDRYGIKQIGIAGISPTNEPSIRQIQSIIELVETNKFQYIMFEENIPTDYAVTVQEQVGADILWLRNLESLTKEDDASNEDYFSVMRKNIEALRVALQ